MASQIPPKKNTAFTLYFTLYKNDGAIVANPGTYTKKRIIDGGDAGDIAASVTEEDTTYGCCSLVLSSDDMNGDAIWVYITDDTAGTVPFTCTLYTAANTQDGVEGKIDTIDGIVDNILVDTGTTLDGRIPAALTANGNMKCSLVEILTTALTETSGLIAAAFKKFFNVATPTGTVNSIPDAVAGAAGGIAIVGSVMGKSPATLAAADVSGNLPADVKAITAGVDLSDAMKSSVTAAVPTAAVNADAVWDELVTGHDGAGKAGAQLWTDIDAIAVDVAGLDGEAMRGTDSAALASVCTEARLAELDAANIPADVDAILADTGTDGVVVAAGSKTGYDLVDAPNATAITAIQTSIKAITIADGDTLAANSWLLWLRRLKWVLTGKLSVVDADGSFTLTKDDGTTAAGTGSITDDDTTTIRTVITWA